MRASPHSYQFARRKGARAFTLIELVFSMAIASSVLVALLALIPLGSNTLREAMNNTVQSRILQGITSELQLTDWELDDSFRPQLTSLLGHQIRYYDDQGTELQSPGDHVFTARVRLSTDGAELPGSEIHLPAPQGRGMVPSKKNPFLRRLTLEITDIPGADLDFFDDPERRRSVRTVTTAVVSLHPIKD